MTLRDLLRSSFRLIAVLREGQGPNVDDITDSLVVLNAMLTTWSVDRLFIFCIRSDQYNLVANQQTYQIGVGAPDFDAPRPIRIDRAAVIYTPSGEYSPELPLGRLTARGWEDLNIKNITSTIPTNFYADNQYPFCNINLWPIPTQVLPFLLYTWQQITTGFTPSQLDTELSFPPGYEDAIRYNLAVRLAPEWDKPLRADVLTLARESKAFIQSLNAPAPVLTCDPAMLGQRGGGMYFSHLTGQMESH
jgi:hypothetical protein